MSSVMENSTCLDLNLLSVNTASLLHADSSGPGCSNSISKEHTSTTATPPHTMPSVLPGSNTPPPPLLVTANHTDVHIAADPQNAITNNTVYGNISNVEQNVTTGNINDESTPGIEENVSGNVGEGTRSKGANGTSTGSNLNNKYTCSVCGKEFSQLGWLQKHLEKCQEKYQCDSCPLRLKNMKCLKAHQKIFHGPDSGSRCEECDAMFSTANKLAVHIRNVHEAEKVCPHCDSKSKNKKSLRYHIRWHCKGLKKNDLKQTLTTPSEKSKDSQKKALFKCKECKAVFSSRNGLRKHIKIHEKINELSENRVETVKNDESENIVSDDMIVDNTSNNVVLICDGGNVVDQGQLLDIEVVYVEES